MRNVDDTTLSVDVKAELLILVTPLEKMITRSELKPEQTKLRLMKG